MIKLFEYKEAIASVTIDNDPDLQTISEGLTRNSKLYDIKINICTSDNQMIWNGPIAHASRIWRRLKHD